MERVARGHVGHGVPAPAPSPQLCVTCIEASADLASLRPVWQALHDQDPRATPFTSWEWAMSWWQAYGGDRALRVLVFSDADAVVAIAPLFVGLERLPVGRSRVLRLIGDGSHDSDHLGFVMRTGTEDRVEARLADWLRERPDWDALRVRELSEHSPLPAMLRRVADACRMKIAVDETPCSVLELPATFDAFLRERQARFRSKLRSLLRKVDDSSLVFETTVEPRELRARLRSLYRLHQQRWQAAGEPGVFGSRAKRVFYAHFVPRFARRGWLRLYSLRKDETYVAHQLCFGTAGVTYLLQEGFDVADPAASHGQALRAAVIRHLIAGHERVYDFLGGVSRHKEDWGSRQGRMIHLVMARNTWRGYLYFKLPLWRASLAPVVKRVVPRSILTRIRRLLVPA